MKLLLMKKREFLLNQKKKSILKPKAKESNKKTNLFFFSGYKKTKVIYKYGFTYPKNKILFNTKTCKKTKNTNSNPKYTVLFIS